MAKAKNKYFKYLKPFKNIFFLIFVVFAIWMLFFDTHSWFLHNELNKDIEKLEEEKKYYRNEIAKDKKEIKELSTEEGLEKFGRENYNMKKKNEEIFIIEYEDSIPKSDKNE